MDKNVPNQTFNGKSISFGHAIGKAFVYKDILSRDLHYYSINKEDVKNEIRRIKEAFSKVLGDIKELESNVKDEIGGEQANIFKVHEQILRDKTLWKDIVKELKEELINAEHAVKNVFRKWANKFKISQSETIKSKADDIEDLSRRILCSFMRCDLNLLERVPPNSIIVAKRLLPSDTVKLKKKNVKGIIVEEGSEASHSAIIARSLGIPAVTGIEEATRIFSSGKVLILDGYKGLAIKNPENEQLQSYKKLICSMNKLEGKLIKRAQKKVKTGTGIRVKVNANIASKEDVKMALKRGCDGVGLFRIEQLYMASKVLPKEKQLIKKLSNIISPLENKKITLRLLDIGADKTLPYLEIEKEPTPVLGLRGVRLLLKYKNLLKTQLKVAFKLSENRNIRVLVPVVTFPEDMEEVKKTAEECRKEIRSDEGISVKTLKIGAMIETPAAVENIHKIAKISDFLSIGTNDLIQYSVAAGRDNPNVAEYYEKGAKIAIKYIRKIAKASEKQGIECSVCGEIAGDLKWVKSIINSGVRDLSVSPYLIPVIKDGIMKI